MAVGSPTPTPSTTSTVVVPPFGPTQGVSGGDTASAGLYAFLIVVALIAVSVVIFIAMNRSLKTARSNLGGSVLPRREADRIPVAPYEGRRAPARGPAQPAEPAATPEPTVPDGLTEPTWTEVPLGWSAADAAPQPSGVSAATQGDERAAADGVTVPATGAPVGSPGEVAAPPPAAGSGPQPADLTPAPAVPAAPTGGADDAAAAPPEPAPPEPSPPEPAPREPAPPEPSAAQEPASEPVPEPAVDEPSWWTPRPAGPSEPSEPSTRSHPEPPV